MTSFRMWLLRLIAVFAVGVVVGFGLCTNVAKAHPADIERSLTILKAIGQIDKDNPAVWTKSGKPKVSAIEAVLGADISAKERDDAWAAREALSDLLSVPQLEEQNADLERQVGRWAEAAQENLQRAKASEGEVNRLERSLRVARDATRDAERRADHAEEAQREAEARAAGHGPAVSAKCKRGVTKALKEKWFSGEDKAALSAACLE